MTKKRKAEVVEEEEEEGEDDSEESRQPNPPKKRIRLIKKVPEMAKAKVRVFHLDTPSRED